jgi:uncharacterized protein
MTNFVRIRLTISGSAMGPIHNLFISPGTLCTTTEVKGHTDPLTNVIHSPIIYIYLFFKRIFHCLCLQLFRRVFAFRRGWLVTFAAWISISTASAQELTRFYYPDGSVSSEGVMAGGKPDGFWKTYFPGGVLKSEGNRKNHQLDSTWNFYRQDGSLERSITYAGDIKNGPEKWFTEDGVLKEVYTYENNIRQGESLQYYDSGELWKRIPYVNNKEEGRALEYARDGRIITVLTYRNGFIYASERINRFDDEERRTGQWRDLYANGQIREEGNWTSGLRNGIFKFYDRKGFLERIENYVNGQLVIGDDASVVLDIRREYDEQGRVRSTGSYRDGKKHGTFRNYDEQGNEQGATLYELDRVTAEGLLDSIGRRQGKWKMYHPEGELRAEGEYRNGLREGAWAFYFRNGKTEQKGSYREDLPVGNWQWFYASGAIHRDETYRRGKEDGRATEYDSLGNVLCEGDYIDGLRSGLWVLSINDHRETGEYVDGERNGKWFWYYGDGSKAFEGEFMVGTPVGRHRYWYPNGILKMKGEYEGGELDGPWQYFDETGMLIVETQYDQGVAVRINGKKIRTGSLPADEP